MSGPAVAEKKKAELLHAKLPLEVAVLSDVAAGDDGEDDLRLHLHGGGTADGRHAVNERAAQIERGV